MPTVVELPPTTDPYLELDQLTPEQLQREHATMLARSPSYESMTDQEVERFIAICSRMRRRPPTPEAKAKKRLSKGMSMDDLDAL